MPPQPLEKVSIRPGVSILSVLRHLNYKPWFALAEFVDNSIQSYVENQAALRAAERARAGSSRSPSRSTRLARHGSSYRDNAAGIPTRLSRARSVRPSSRRTALAFRVRHGHEERRLLVLPASGRSARRRLAKLVERTVRSISIGSSRTTSKSLTSRSRPAKVDDHYTEIVLHDLHKCPSEPLRSARSRST